MRFVPTRAIQLCGPVLALVFVTVPWSITNAEESKKSADLFMNLEPSAATGHQIIMNELMASTAMKVKDIDRLWNVWEKEEKAEAEQADHDELMRLTFERYGWIKRPGDEVPTLPLGYTVDGKGNMGSNCFSCHGGKVAGKKCD